MPKVQLTLTGQEAQLLSAKGAQMGYGLVKYVKYVLSQEAEKAIKEGLVVAEEPPAEPEIPSPTVNRPPVEAAPELVEAPEVPEVLDSVATETTAPAPAVEPVEPAEAVEEPAEAGQNQAYGSVPLGSETGEIGGPQAPVEPEQPDQPSAGEATPEESPQI